MINQKDLCPYYCLFFSSFLLKSRYTTFGIASAISKLGDPNGKFTLRSLLDLNGNKLSFERNGIKSTSLLGSVGGCNATYVVCFNRNGANADRIDSITDASGKLYAYAYGDGEGNLTKVTLPQKGPDGLTDLSVTYKYYTNASNGAAYANSHFFKEALDPRGTSAALTTYYDDIAGNGGSPALKNRLKDVRTPIDDTTFSTTSFTYDLPGRVVTTTNSVDGSYTATTTDAYGKTVLEKLNLGNGTTRSTAYGYDASHNITRTILPNPLTGGADISGPNSRVMTTTYDLKGNRTGVFDTLNNPSTTVYNEYGGPRILTDRENHSWNIGYNPNFMPTDVNDTLGSAGGYTFNDRGSSLSQQDGKGNTTLYEYDAYGNKTKETDPLGRATLYSYDPMGRMTTMTDPKGVISKSEYDNIGRLITTTAAFGTPVAQVTVYGYDENGNRTSQTEGYGTPQQRTTTYVYDRANHLVRTTLPDTNYTQSFYDFRGNVTKAIDQGGRSTLYAYDVAGQLVSTTVASGTPDAATMCYDYDRAGRKTRDYQAYHYDATHLDCRTAPYTEYTLDSEGRTTKTSVAINASTRADTLYEYDKTGRKKKEIDPNLLPTLYGYNGRGQATLFTYTTGITMGMEYDLSGNQTAKIDQGGRRTIYTFDSANRLLGVTNPMTETTSYHYDELNRLNAMLDANLHQTAFKYDELGRQTRKIWPDGSYEGYGYDGVNNRTSVRLADANINTYDYDSLSRLKRITYFDDPTSTLFTYTVTGQRQSVSNPRGSGTVGTTAYTYDERDRLKTITVPGSATPDLAYTYDERGNRIGLTTPSGSTSYGYDSANRLTAVQGPGETAPNAFFYDDGGRRTKLNLANGAVVTYTYDTLNRLTNLNHYSQIPSGTPLSSYVYSYDGSVAAGKVGLKTGVSEYQGGSLARTLAWTYDEADRLTSEGWTEGALPAVTTSFSYDMTGNRQTQTVSGSGGPITNYTYNALDQLTGLNGTGGGGVTPLSYAYDGRGNLLTVKANSTTVQSYSYNGADRLTGAIVNNGTTTTSLYIYDGDGRRVKSVIGGTTTNYLWDEASQYGDVVRETDGSGSLKTSYTLSGVSGELVSQKRAGTTQPEYYLLDGRSSVRGLATTTGSNVVVNDRYTYDAFGTAHAGSTATFGTTPNVYRYTSQQVDSATGLYDLRARYYNPADGRFLSRDAAPYLYKNPSEANRYVYTHNNPTNFSDYSGYETEEYGSTSSGSLSSIFSGRKLGTKLYRILLALSVVLITLALEQSANNNTQNGLYFFYHGTNAVSARSIVLDPPAGGIKPVGNTSARLGSGFYTYSSLVLKDKSRRSMDDASDQATSISQVINDYSKGAVVQISLTKYDFDYMVTKGWVKIDSFYPEAQVVLFSDNDPVGLEFLNDRSSRAWMGLDSNGYVPSF